MSAMDKIRGSRSLETLAERLPESLLGLAAETARLSEQLSLMRDEVSALSEEARSSAAELAESREQLSQDWTESQAAAAATWETAVAERIEPLAQAMAALADEARQSVTSVEHSSRQQAAAWLASQAKAAELQASAAQQSAAATAQLRRAAEQGSRVAWSWRWPLWIGVVTAGMAPLALLLIGSWVWLPQGLTLREARDGSLWLQIRREPAFSWTAPRRP